MATKADKRAEWLGKHFRFLVGETRAGAHIAPVDSFESLCGIPCLNRQPNFKLDKTCKRCRKDAESMAKDAIQ